MVNNIKDKIGEKGGGYIMTIEKALSLTTEEFLELDKSYEGFNKETYTNHQTHDGCETFMDFLIKGSRRIKKHSIIKGKLI